MLKALVVLFLWLAFAEARSCDLQKMRWTGMPFDKEGLYHDECEPQILYSWVGSLATIKPDDLYWPFRRKTAIFFHRTPLATSIYGNFSYRVKLKDNVQYKEVPWNEAHYKCLYPEEEKRHTVYVNQDPNGFSEYVLCSSGPVESWSFGLSDHYHEMKREFSMIKNYGALNVDGFLNPNTKKYECDECFQKYTIHDARNDGSEKTISNSIQRMRDVVGLKYGRVYDLVDKTQSRDAESIRKHFETKLELPFH